MEWERHYGSLKPFDRVVVATECECQVFGNFPNVPRELELPESTAATLMCRDEPLTIGQPVVYPDVLVLVDLVGETQDLLYDRYPALSRLGIPHIYGLVDFHYLERFSLAPN